MVSSAAKVRELSGEGGAGATVHVIKNLVNVIVGVRHGLLFLVMARKVKVSEIKSTMVGARDDSKLEIAAITRRH